MFGLGPKGGSGCEPQVGQGCVCFAASAVARVAWRHYAFCGGYWQWDLIGGKVPWEEQPRIIYQSLGSIQAARRATGAGGEMGWAVSAMRWGVVGGGEGVDGFGGGKGLLAAGCGFGARCGVEYGDAVGKGGGAGVAAGGGGGGGAADGVGEGGEERFGG